MNGTALLITLICLEVAALGAIALYSLYRWRKGHQKKQRAKRPRSYELPPLYNRGAGFRRLSRNFDSEAGIMGVGCDDNQLSIQPFIGDISDVTDAVCPEPVTHTDSAVRDVSLVPIVIGIDDNKPDIDGKGMSPLHIAAMQGDLAAVRGLCSENGVNLDDINELGYTPLAMAAIYGHCNVVGCLIGQGADLTAGSPEGLSPLHLASREGQVEVARMLCQSNADVDHLSRGYSPLGTAAYKGHIQVVNLLIEKEADVNLAGPGCFAPLHLASIGGHLEVVRCLCCSNAAINGLSQGYSALGSASARGQSAVAKYLIQNNADIMLGGTNGLTSLFLAAKEGHLEVVRLLCEAGANVDRQCEGGDTALHAACKGRHIRIVDILVEYGASVNLENDLGNTPLYGRLDIAEHLASGMPYERDGRYPQTEAFHAAISEGNTPVARYLLAKGFNVKGLLQTSDRPVMYGRDGINGILREVGLMDTPLRTSGGLALTYEEGSRDQKQLTNGIWPCIDAIQNPNTKFGPTAESFSALKAIQQAIHIRRCDFDNKGTPKTPCQSPNIHHIHGEMEKAMKYFVEAQQRKRGDIISLDPTGAFYADNKIGKFNKLEYIAVLRSPTLPPGTQRVQEAPDSYHGSFSKEQQDEIDSTIVRLIQELTDYFMNTNDSNYPLGGNHAKSCFPIPHNSGLRVLFEWPCARGHTHRLQVIVIIALQLEGTSVGDVCNHHAAFDSQPFSNAKDEVSTLPALWIIQTEHTPETQTAKWGASFQHTVGVIFKCLDKLSPNIRVCYHLLQLFTELLPMKIIYTKQINCAQQTLESMPVVSVNVVYNTLLQEVVQHPSADDWADHLLPDRLASVLTAIRPWTYTDFFKVTLEQTLCVSSINEKRKDKVKEILESDIQEFICALTQKQHIQLSLASDRHAILAKASYYSREKKICLFSRLPKGQLFYTLHPESTLRFGSAALRQDIGLGDPNELIYYKIPEIKPQCEKIPLYSEVYSVALKKFETAERNQLDKYKFNTL